MQSACCEFGSGVVQRVGSAERATFGKYASVEPKKSSTSVWYFFGGAKKKKEEGDLYIVMLQLFSVIEYTLFKHLNLPYGFLSTTATT